MFTDNTVVFEEVERNIYIVSIKGKENNFCVHCPFVFKDHGVKHYLTNHFPWTAIYKFEQLYKKDKETSF